MVRVSKYLSTYASSYSLDEREICALFGAHSAGLIFVLHDALWRKYALGAMYGVEDPSFRAPARRNIFLHGVPGANSATGSGEAGVTALMRRGVRFLACSNSIDALAHTLSTQGHGNVVDLREEVSSATVPGVMVVPAMSIAGNRAQESGYSYAFLS